jgi:uncharacterized membrane protein YfcA
MIMARVGAGVTATLSEQALRRALGIFMLLIAPLVPAKAYSHDTRNEGPQRTSG